MEKIKEVCPHAILCDIEGELVAVLLFEAQEGTDELICESCGMTIGNEDDAKKIAERWIDDPFGWSEQALEHQSLVQTLRYILETGDYVSLN